jgi:hypothetical protein
MVRVRGVTSGEATTASWQWDPNLELPRLKVRPLSNMAWPRMPRTRTTMMRAKFNGARWWRDDGGRQEG